MTSRFRTTQSWKTTVDATKPNQFWKPKVLQNQNDHRFYKRNVSKGQVWVVKKQTMTEKDSTKNDGIKNEKVFEMVDEEFQSLNDYFCVEVPKVLSKKDECQNEQRSSLA
ncbi:hypothetical protein Hanom_Chr11g01063701 [Helianthus anomalus]